MPKNELLESCIRDSLTEAANQITASDMLKIKIHNKLSTQKFKENSMKKVFSVKKAVILAAVICCLATATVFASGTITQYFSSSSSNPTYTEIPTAKKLTSDIGYAPKIIGSFSNGYSFKGATIVSTSGQSDAGEHLSDFKALDTDYTSADGQTVTLSSNNSGTSVSSTKIDQATNYEGIDMNYSEQAYKFVPVDYKLTADDQEAQANGSVVFSYGSDSIESVTYQFVSWVDGNTNYQLMTQNTVLSYTDLFTMAKELINQK